MLHRKRCVTRSFNYITTTASNGFVDEQAKYGWKDIVCNSSSWAATDRYNGFTLFLGSGDTPVTPEDYKLENAVILDVTAASCYQEPNGKIIVSRTFKNNTEEAVTIKEAGCYLFAQIPNAQYYAPVVMIARKVLKTPVIIPVGEIYTFNYSIDMSRISFEEIDD